MRTAVIDLGLWRNPDDADVQRLIWFELKDLKDRAALEGFPAMRAAALAAAP